MPKGKKKVEVEKEVKKPHHAAPHRFHVEEPVPPTEKEQLQEREKELSGHREWMVTNKYQDIGQVEVALASVVKRLSELSS